MPVRRYNGRCMIDPDAGVHWPTSDFTQVPYSVYVDPALFEQEQQQIFAGPTWHLVGLECEVAAPGAFLTASIGTTPIVVNRAQDGRLCAFVNRCAHRGARVVREIRGSRSLHTCIYHRWCYDAAGNLIGVPHERGAGGQGGYPEDFDKTEHGLQLVRVAVHAGVIFATLSAAPLPLLDYLGAAIAERISLICNRPLQVMGYVRQTIQANWKLFVENNRDAYHGALLHAFIPKFDLLQLEQRSDVQLGGDGMHAMLTSRRDLAATVAAAGPSPAAGQLRLEDAAVIRSSPEFGDITLTVLSLFPTSLFTCIGNLLTCRQIRPLAPDRIEVLYTLFAFADDDVAMPERRRALGNLEGPSGFTSMEDVEVLELIQSSITTDARDAHAFVGLGDSHVRDEPHMMSEASIRGFWKTYSSLMELSGDD